MSALFDSVVAFFEHKGWPFEQHEEMPLLRFNFKSENEKWVCYARVREEANQFILLSILPERVPEEKRALAAEYLLRANLGLNIGAFEMDYDDGEVRFKTALDLSYTPFTPELAEPLLNASFYSVDIFSPGLKAVLAGEMLPRTAIDKIEEEQDNN